MLIVWLIYITFLQHAKTATTTSNKTGQNISTRALTSLNLTKYYYRKCKTWSDYVIDTGPIHVYNSCPGVVTGVAWHGWSRDLCARGSGFDSWGNHLF